MANDELARLKRFVAYTVTGVWAIMFLAALVQPPASPTVYVSVQGTMAGVLGWLYADRLRRK